MNRLKLTPKQYWKLTPKEFYHALQDHNKEREETYRGTMEATRLVVMHAWNASGRLLKNVVLDPLEFDMMKFSWDEKRKVRKQTTEEQKQIMMGIVLRSKTKNKK